MFCNQCGTQLPEGSKFCSTCGANLTVSYAAAQGAPKQKPAAPSMQKDAAVPQSASKPQKKKTPVWLTVVIVLAAFVLGKFVIAPSMLSEPEDSNPGNQVQENLSVGGNSDNQILENPSIKTEAGTNMTNGAYEAVFDDTYIVHFQSFFNMDMASFAKKLEDGTVCCSDYGYENDVVIDFVETMYIPVSEYTDEQKAEVESNVKANLSALEALTCCSVNYNMSINYLTVTITYSGVDQPENYSALYDANILTTNTFISMSETEKVLLNDGFIKK